MKRGLDSVIAEVIGTAQANPERAPMIYADAARRFARLAANPKNTATARALARTAQDFAAMAERPPVIEDFDDLLNETYEAYHAVSDGPGDELARMAVRREIHERESGENQMRITPRSITEDTPLGRSANLKFAPTAEDIRNGIVDQQTVIFWQGRKLEAQACTIDIGVIAPPLPDPLSTFGFRPFAIVEYGSDGFKTTAKLDVGYGTRFTIVGNYVTVLLGMGPPPPESLGGSGILSVGASLGFFAAPSIAPVTYTAYIDGTGGSTQSIIRPQKAQVLLPVQCSDPVAPITLQFYDFGSVLLYTQKIVIGTAAANTPIPITNDVARIDVTYTGMLVGVQVRLPFQLAL